MRGFRQKRIIGDSRRKTSYAKIGKVEEIRRSIGAAIYSTSSSKTRYLTNMEANRESSTKPFSNLFSKKFEKSETH